MIYLDHNATTPLDLEVKKRMEDIESFYCNASGSYGGSLISKGILNQARNRVSELIQVDTNQVIFTSGSTEAITLSIWDALLRADTSRKRVIVGTLEHKAIIETVSIAARILGFKVDHLNSDNQGRYSIRELEALMNDDVALICYMYANNETGVIQSIDEVLDLKERFGSKVLCDTTQIFGKLEYQSKLKYLDYFCLSSHKFYGPKGVGALVISKEIVRGFRSISPGGGQENGIRGGTSNVPGIWGLCQAADLYAFPENTQLKQYRELISSFYERLKRVYPRLKVNGDGQERLPNTINLMFEGLVADEILVSLKEVQASKASACTAGVDEPSHVLRAMGLTSEQAEASIRFSLGKSTSNLDIERAVGDLSQAISRVRSFEGIHN